MLVIWIISLLFVSFVFAEDEAGFINKGFVCLRGKLGGNCGDTRNTEQVVFSLLAMNGDSNIRGNCKSSLNNKKEGNCWGDSDSSSCDLKSTALAVLGLNHAGENVSDGINWLLDNTQRASGLNWFLEIDTNNESRCTIEVGGVEKTFNIEDDKKIRGSSSCFSPSEDGYFLKIKNACLDEKFVISCDNNFITTLFYKKTSEETYHISGNTHSAQAYDLTEEIYISYFPISRTNFCTKHFQPFPRIQKIWVWADYQKCIRW